MRRRKKKKELAKTNSFQSLSQNSKKNENRQADMRQEYSADYPLGGMLEPYDIEREQELVEKYEREANELILSEC